MDCGKSWHALNAPPNFSPSSASFLRVSKVRWSTMSHCWTASPSPTVSSRDASWPQHCSPSSLASCSVRLKRTCQKGIYICFWTDGSLVNLKYLHTCPKTTEKLITELQFSDLCALLNHMEEALEHIINHFSDAATNFSLTISLKKTEVFYQPPPCSFCLLHPSFAASCLSASNLDWLFSLMSTNCLGMRPFAAMTDSWFPPVQAVSWVCVFNTFLEHHDQSFLLAEENCFGHAYVTEFAQAGINHQPQQQEASDRDSWCSSES